VLLGKTDRLADIPGGLTAFVKGGGAVLLATDRPLTDKANREELERAAGVAVTRQTLVCRPPPVHLSEFCYHGLDYCPFLFPPAGGANPDLFRDPHREGAAPPLRVATNVPAMLVHGVSPTGQPRLPGDVRLLATLPRFCYYELRDGRV